MGNTSGPLRLSAERVLTESGIRPATITIAADGAIVSVDPVIVPHAEHRDGVLSPGLIDLQVNGKGSIDLWTALLEGDDTDLVALEDLVLDEGVTTWLPTLVTNSLDHYRPALDRLRRFGGSSRTSIPGAHLEGPQLGERPGAHRVDLIATPDRSWWRSLVADVRLVTLGAETPGVTDLVSWLVANGVTVSIGHSAPSRREFEAAVDGGASMVTHLFNAMSGIHHRDDSLALLALNDRRVACGLIVDLVHVSPEAVDLAFRAARGGVVLVTDSVGSMRGSVGPVALDNTVDAPRLSDGTLAGSRLTMPRAMRHAMTVAELDLAAVLVAATASPARVIKASDRGTLSPGLRGDVVELDDRLAPSAVWVAGRRVR